MSFQNIIFTHKGRILHSRAQTGTKINFKRLAMGDGSLSGQSIEELTDLISLKKNIPITKMKDNSDGTAQIGGVFDNAGLTQGFYWREIGLFADDPDKPGQEILYCYGNATSLAEYIPAEGSNILEKQINILAIISNATNVSATINSSLVYATKEDLDQKINIIVTQTPPLIAEREEKTFYFKVTDTQSVGTGIGNDIKVSPNMGLKIL